MSICDYIHGFFGSRTPVNWTPKEGKMKLLKDVLGTLKSDDITLIICKSVNFVNYDVDKFLQEMLTYILCKSAGRQNVEY